MTPQTLNKSDFEGNGKKIDDKNYVCKEMFLTKRIGTDYSYRHQIVWKNAIGFLFLHLMALWGAIIFLTGGIMFNTFLWCKFYIPFN